MQVGWMNGFVIGAVYGAAPLCSILSSLNREGPANLRPGYGVGEQHARAPVPCRGGSREGVHTAQCNAGELAGRAHGSRASHWTRLSACKAFDLTFLDIQEPHKRDSILRLYPIMMRSAQASAVFATFVGEPVPVLTHARPWFCWIQPVHGHAAVPGSCHGQ